MQSKSVATKTHKRKSSPNQFLMQKLVSLPELGPLTAAFNKHIAGGKFVFRDFTWGDFSGQVPQGNNPAGKDYYAFLSLFVPSLTAAKTLRQATTTALFSRFWTSSCLEQPGLLTDETIQNALSKDGEIDFSTFKVKRDVSKVYHAVRTNSGDSISCRFVELFLRIYIDVAFGVAPGKEEGHALQQINIWRGIMDLHAKRSKKEKAEMNALFHSFVTFAEAMEREEREEKEKEGEGKLQAAAGGSGGADDGPAKQPGGGCKDGGQEERKGKQEGEEED